MKNKVIALLIKRGNSEARAVSAVEQNLDWAMKAYPEAKASFLADVCLFV
jgi:hypothetical protein